MTERILGEAGSTKRKRFLLLPVLATAFLALFWITGAQAVHDDGVFELDRNAVTEADTVPLNGLNDGEDWDLVCPNAHPDGAAACLGGTTADTSRFIDDFPPADKTIFTGGGSKDDLDVPQWLYKDGAVPDKDNLLHGFAARYDDHLYFGADRESASGDAALGVWFFQSAVGPDPSGSGTRPFIGSHIDGDVLVLTDFTGGGAAVTARVFEWNGPGGSNGTGAINGTLDLIYGISDPPTPADCVGPPQVPPGDPACATVNTEDEDSPWAYQAKEHGSPAGVFPAGHFFEGGIDLGALGLADECFSSFLVETRSSQSIDAVLKDFVAGQFEICVPNLTTQASNNGTVQPGTAVHDTATITVTGGANPPDPTGSASNVPPNPVTFFLCFDASSTPACTSGGTNIGTGNLVGGTPTDGIATADSPNVNTTASPLASGFYCFRAEWPGDSNYGPFSPPLTNPDNTNECFRVLLLGTTTVTTPQTCAAGSCTDITGDVALNTSVFDHAVVTGDSAGGTPTGTVDFFICNPSQVTGSAGSEVCASGNGSALSGNPITATAVLNSSPPQSEATSSPAVVANQLGVWCFRATYTPGGANGAFYTGSSDNTHGECFKVTTTSSMTSLQNWLPNDRVTLTSVGSVNLKGTLVITLRESSCTGTVKYTEPTFTSPLAGWGSGTNFDTTNAIFKVDASNIVSGGVYYWRAVFTSSDPLVASSTKCEKSTLVIDNNPAS